MGYAIATDGISWRRVESAADLQAGETFSDTLPAKPLSYHRMMAARRISSDFTAEINLGFVTQSGIKMDCDISRIQRLKSAHDLAVLTGATEMPVVVDYDNASHQNMAMQDVLDMIIELGTHYQTLFIKKQNLRAQILDGGITTEAELDAIVW